MTFFRFLLTFGALLSSMAAYASPAFADTDDPLSGPLSRSITACTDDNVHRMMLETTAFYRHVDKENAKMRASAGKKPTSKTPAEKRPAKAAGGHSLAVRHLTEARRLWNRLPHCDDPEDRGNLSHQAFKQYMSVVLAEAYESAILAMNARSLGDAKFYVRTYLGLDKSVRREAAAEKWTSWLAFEKWTLPKMQKLDDLW